MTDDTQQPYDDVLEPPADGGPEDAAIPTDEPADAAAAIDAPGADTRAAEERDELRDQLLRMRAEFDNYRKRIERDRAQMIARASEDALRDILPIIDDLERALAADPGPDVASFHQGVEMIYKQMLDLLARRGLEPIDAIGQDFDPNIHEAVAYEPAAGRREGEIIGELRKGYRIGDRLVRPSMVRVAQEVH
jgi:molecular chaperone GrpE